MYSMEPSTLNRSGHDQPQSAVSQDDGTETKMFGMDALPLEILLPWQPCQGVLQNLLVVEGQRRK